MFCVCLACTFDICIKLLLTYLLTYIGDLVVSNIPQGGVPTFLTCICVLQVYHWAWQWKNFENRL